MTEKLNPIINNNQRCLSEDEIRNYTEGSLPAGEMHRVEKHLLHCELCSDAIEGLGLLKNKERLAAMEQKIDTLIKGGGRKSPVIIWLRSNIRFAAAAALVALIASVVFLKNSINENQEDTLSENLQQKQSPPAERKENKQEPPGEAEEPPPSSDLTSTGKRETPQKPVNTKTEEKSVYAYQVLSPSVAEPMAMEIPDTIALPAQDALSDYVQAAPSRGAETAAGAPERELVKTEEEDKEIKGKSKGLARSLLKKENRSAPAENVPPAARIMDESKAVSGETTEAYTIADQMPQYPGGDTALQAYIKKNLQYPVSAMESRTEGTIYVSFSIDESGNVLNPEVTKIIPGCLPCGDEAVRLVKNMPRWIPGKNNGKPVHVQYSLPIEFRLKQKQ